MRVAFKVRVEEPIYLGEVLKEILGVVWDVGCDEVL